MYRYCGLSFGGRLDGHGSCVSPAVADLAQPQVAQLGLSAFDQDVAHVQVPVHDALLPVGMERLQRPKINKTYTRFASSVP